MAELNLLPQSFYNLFNELAKKQFIAVAGNNKYKNEKNTIQIL